MMLEKPRPAEESPLRPVEIDAPVPGPGQVRVRVRYCGVCHTDLHIVEGELSLPRLPVVPGHQVAGEVESLGAGVRTVRKGDRVGIPWLHWTDGVCHYCRSGQENLCEKAQFTGLNVDGGYAELVVVDEHFCCPLPPAFSDEHAAPLLCAGIIGYRSFKLSGAKTGDHLGLYGFGASAHIVLQLARHLGCVSYVFTRTAAHGELASRLGAAWVGDARQLPPAPLDAAIVFAPAGWVVLEALRATRPGGTVACAGITMSPIPAMDYSLLYRERVLRSAANSTRQDARELLELAAAVPVRTEVNIYPLAEANRALLDMKHSRIAGAAVLQI
jgi:propanol-preferring alcohol dehydrogenase